MRLQRRCMAQDISRLLGFQVEPFNERRNMLQVSPMHDQGWLSKHIKITARQTSRPAYTGRCPMPRAARAGHRRLLAHSQSRGPQ